MYISRFCVILYYIIDNISIHTTQVIVFLNVVVTICDIYCRFATCQIGVVFLSIMHTSSIGECSGSYLIGLLWLVINACHVTYNFVLCTRFYLSYVVELLCFNAAWPGLMHTSSIRCVRPPGRTHRIT